MALTRCYKPKDVDTSCDSADLQALSGGLLVLIEAFKPTKSATKKFTIEEIEIIDPDTGAYPLPTSAYYPVKVSWEKNAGKPNYEVVSSEVKKDSYTQIFAGIIINDSESDEGKENTMALATNKWVYVYKLSGVANAADAYQILGLKNGLQYVIEPTSDDVGGRVTGSLRSLAGGAEGNPNGYNFLLAGGITATDTFFNNRLKTVVIP
jgi:hypothetical protein